MYKTKDIKNVGWSVGSYCNANCVHCYSKNVRQQDNPLTENEIILILDKLKLFGITTLNLGGNEPIFTNGKNIKSSKLPFIIKEAKKRDFIIGITTNGVTAVYLYEEERSVFYMVDDWDISIDSPFKKEHDTNRGIPLFTNAIEALRIFKENKCNASIVMCLMNWNSSKKHVIALASLCRKYKVDLRINSLKPILSNHFQLLPDYNQIAHFFNCLNQYYDQVSCTDPVLVLNTFHRTNSCPCGTYSFAISHKKEDGSVPISPCVYLQNLMHGNILTDKIDDLVKSESFNKFRERKSKLSNSCIVLDCSLFQVCRGGCVAYTYLVSKDFNACDPRCPIRSGNLRQNNLNMIKQRDNMSTNKVHENYLCTWIGRLK